MRSTCGAGRGTARPSGRCAGAEGALSDVHQPAPSERSILVGVTLEVEADASAQPVLVQPAAAGDDHEWGASRHVVTDARYEPQPRIALRAQAYQPGGVTATTAPELREPTVRVAPTTVSGRGRLRHRVRRHVRWPPRSRVVCGGAIVMSRMVSRALRASTRRSPQAPCRALRRPPVATTPGRVRGSIPFSALSSASVTTCLRFSLAGARNASGWEPTSSLNRAFYGSRSRSATRTDTVSCMRVPPPAGSKWRAYDSIDGY